MKEQIAEILLKFKQGELSIDTSTQALLGLLGDRRSFKITYTNEDLGTKKMFFTTRKCRWFKIQFNPHT